MSLQHVIVASFKLGLEALIHPRKYIVKPVPPRWEGALSHYVVRLSVCNIDT